MRPWIPEVRFIKKTSNALFTGISTGHAGFPRGIMQHDWLSDQLRDSLHIGPSMGDVLFITLENNEQVIAFDTRAYDNNVVGHGMRDDSAYVGVFDRDPLRVRWAKALSGKGTATSVQAVDLDGNGTLELVTYVNTKRSLAEEAVAYVHDARTGELVRSIPFTYPIFGYVIADFNQDTVQDAGVLLTSETQSFLYRLDLQAGTSSVNPYVPIPRSSQVMLADDLDGDALPDVLTNGPDGLRIWGLDAFLSTSTPPNPKAFLPASLAFPSTGVGIFRGEVGPQVVRTVAGNMIFYNLEENPRYWVYRYRFLWMFGIGMLGVIGIVGVAHRYRRLQQFALAEQKKLKMHVRHFIANGLPSDRPDVKSTSPNPIGPTELRRVLDTHFSDPAFTVKRFAEDLYVEPRTLQIRVRALTGITPSKLIRMRRTNEAARRLLASSDLDIATLHEEVGLKTASHLDKAFQERFGLSLNDFYQKYKNKGYVIAQ